MSFVFISYARKDKELAEKLCNYLTKNEIEYWIDTSRISGSSEWDIAIDNALREAFCCLLVLTQNSNNSDYVKYEWAFMRGSEKPVLPLLCDDFNQESLPITLQKINQIDCREGFTGKVSQQIAEFLLEEPTNRFVSIGIHHRLALSFSVVQLANMLLNTSNDLPEEKIIVLAGLVYSLVWTTRTELQSFWLTYSHAFASYHKTSLNRFIKILSSDSLRGYEVSELGAMRYLKNISDAWRLDLRELYVANADSVRGEVSTFLTYPNRFNPTEDYTFTLGQITEYSLNLMKLISQYKTYHSDIFEKYRVEDLDQIAEIVIYTIADK